MNHDENAPPAARRGGGASVTNPTASSRKRAAEAAPTKPASARGGRRRGARRIDDVMRLVGFGALRPAARHGSDFRLHAPGRVARGWRPLQTQADSASESEDEAPLDQRSKSARKGAAGHQPPNPPAPQVRQAVRALPGDYSRVVKFVTYVGPHGRELTGPESMRTSHHRLCRQYMDVDARRMLYTMGEDGPVPPTAGPGPSMLPPGPANDHHDFGAVYGPYESGFFDRQPLQPQPMPTEATHAGDIRQLLQAVQQLAGAVHTLTTEQARLAKMVEENTKIVHEMCADLRAGRFATAAPVVAVVRQPRPRTLNPSSHGVTHASESVYMPRLLRAWCG
jgi:hypothetical protein